MLTCQEVIPIKPVGAFGTLARVCGKPAPNYRQCGRGGSTCKREYAFCPDHGDDARAQERMRTHHEEQHPRDDDGR